MSRPVLLCDIGNVLVHFDFRRAAERFAERSPLTEEEVLRALNPIKDPLESGQLQGEAFVKEGMRLIEFSGSAEEFRHIWCDIFAANALMEPTLESVKGLVPMHLLSNTSDLHKEFLLAEFPVFRHFSDGVYSYSAGCMKPGEKIFRLTIEQLSLDPAQTFYIDDLLPNIQTARQLGFRTFHYSDTRHADLDAELQEWLAELPSAT